MPWTIDDVENLVYATGWWAEFALSSVGGIPSAEAFGVAFVGSFQGVFPSGIPSGESVPTPGLVYPQSVSPSGIGSLEAFGGSALNPGDAQVLPQGIGTAGAFGNPTLTTGATSVAPSGISSSETFGSNSVVPGGVSVSPGGIGSAEAFGSSGVSNVVAPGGIISEEAFGAAQVNFVVSPGGILTSEAFGTPNVMGPPQAIVPTGIASLEAFGGSATTPGAVQLLPQAIASLESVPSPTVSVGPVSVSPSGIVSGEAFGTAKTGQFFGPSGIASAESVGAAGVNLNIAGTGIASEEAFGTATVEVVLPSNVALIASATSATTSVTIPAHQVGDLIVICAFTDGTNPGKPSASGTVPAWVDIDAPGAANSVAIRTASFVATATNHTSGTWSSAQRMIAVVLRGVNSAAPIGAHGTGTGRSNSGPVCPGITMTNSDGSSMVLGFNGFERCSGFGSAPSGWSRIDSTSGSGSQALCLNILSNPMVSSTSAATQSVTSPNGLSNGYYGNTIEIRAH